MPGTSNNEGQPDCPDKHPPHSDSSGKSQNPLFRLLVLTIQGTHEVKGNDPVKTGQGASVTVTDVGKAGYLYPEK